MAMEISKLKEIINPEEDVIVWRIDDYMVIKKLDSGKFIKKAEEIRNTLKSKKMLLSDDKIVGIIKEARKEWRE
jgi:hypothetical protein